MGIHIHRSFNTSERSERNDCGEVVVCNKILGLMLVLGERIENVYSTRICASLLSLKVMSSIFRVLKRDSFEVVMNLFL